MSADVLREAARLMRERASFATVGPWEHTYGGIFVGAKTEDLGISYECHVVSEDDLNFAEDDAEHIASWHPLVALEVAAWVDGLADAMTNPDAPGGSVSTDREERHALAVARAYLGAEVPA